jgi:hypothetical protein
MQDLRRVSPRIDVEAMCWEVIGDHETSALIVDLSTRGARIERPYVGGRIQREAPLQFEVPGIDEVMWAKADVVFDRLVPVRDRGGPFGLIRRTGYRLAVAAARDLRLLREYVYEMHRQRREKSDLDLALASCYMHG